MYVMDPGKEIKIVSNSRQHLGERCVTSQKNWSVYLLPFLLKRSERSFVTDRKRPLIMSVSFLFCGFISHLIGGCKI